MISAMMQEVREEQTTRAGVMFPPTDWGAQLVRWCFMNKMVECLS